MTDRVTTGRPRRSVSHLGRALAAAGLAAVPLVFGVVAAYTADEAFGPHTASRTEAAAPPAEDDYSGDGGDLTKLQTPPGMGLGFELGSRLAQ
ncbi:hypothetical protein A605_09905 [Corynebacterium halotolerans YIM 70093 = DSM 44683]|uniref:Uncharacterized protein n=1 Tax=Corynebacterium halotolerans YIM 70093 = DSM 44683 TaxID=1121362 RepID=M1NNT4_9CORY|nr:hypothetical protein A605_09905 [Corynebacterium halotolerans YIM 70093 = DSM 44683]